jgi:cyclopropane-fatty-acyl-phospholipid synthase
VSTSFFEDTPDQRIRLGYSPAELCERGLIPDVLVRQGMRAMIKRRLRDEAIDDGELRLRRFDKLLAGLRASPIAIEASASHLQHDEIPVEFYQLHLGPALKHSCCLYSGGTETLAQAEHAMLALYEERAQLADGQRILDLGCGWGSLSLWLARHYPNAQIVGLSHLRSQREFIERRAAELGLKNLRIVTGNVVDFEFAAIGVRTAFDRVILIEMFEHMKNYGLLFEKLAGWMKPDAKLFAHVFAHRLLAYPLEVRNRRDWMTQYFLQGGTMPSEALFAYFQDDLRLQRNWWVGGRHYQRTAGHWLAGLDRARTQILPWFEVTYGPQQAMLWFRRWRMFYMGVAELFGYAGGNEWGVAHYLFERRR